MWVQEDGLNHDYLMQWFFIKGCATMKFTPYLKFYCKKWARLDINKEAQGDLKRNKTAKNYIFGVQFLFAFFTATFACCIQTYSKKTYSRYIEEILSCYIKYISNRYRTIYFFHEYAQFITVD